MEDTFIIYETTNLINGKIYVGQHCTSANDGYLGSGKIIKKAIKKYGRKNFTRETLEFCTSANVDEKEIYWIDKLDATNKNIGYNLNPGGEGLRLFGKDNPNFGNKWTDLQKEQQSLKMRGKYVGKDNPNFGNGSKIKGNKNPMFGKNHSEESIQKIILNSGNKYFYNLISPENIEYKNIYLISEFCLKHNLNYQGIYYAVTHSGFYKNWKIDRKLIKEFING